MLTDIVLDTNVLLHADNPEEQRQGEARALLLALQDNTTKLCVDEGFDLDEAGNRSAIGSEYHKHLRFGMLGFAVVAHLAQSARVKFLDRSVPAATRGFIHRHVRSSQDRIFVRVAFNSEGKVFASHDFNDLPQGAREQLRATISVMILSAGGALKLLN